MQEELWVHQHSGQGAKEELPRSSWRRSSQKVVNQRRERVRRR